jgi:long-subunit fatty acid transport protein
MKIRVAVSIAILLSFSALEVALAQQNFNFIGSGARARGMGGAFIGVADDATAISWNPAGLATLEKPEASVVGNYTMDSYKMEVEYTDPALAGFDSDLSFSQSHPSFNFGSVAFPLVVGERNLVLAAAYQRLIDVYLKLKMEFYGMTMELEDKGAVAAISPAAALQVTSEVSAGAAFNIWTGSEKMEMSLDGSDETLLDVDYSGFNVNIGLLARTGKFSVGAVAKTPLTLKAKAGGSAEEMNEEMKYKFPFTFGFGAAVMPTENFTLAADVDIRPYSNTDLSNDTTISAGYEDGTQFRVGLEYLIIQDYGVIPLRLGFRTEPWLSKGFDDEKVTGLVFTGGAGLMIGNVWLDAAYELGMAKTEGDDEDFDGDGIGDKVTFKQTTHSIMVSAVIHFEPFQ